MSESNTPPKGTPVVIPETMHLHQHPVPDDADGQPIDADSASSDDTKPLVPPLLGILQLATTKKFDPFLDKVVSRPCSIQTFKQRTPSAAIGDAVSFWESLSVDTPSSSCRHDSQPVGQSLHNDPDGTGIADADGLSLPSGLPRALGPVPPSVEQNCRPPVMLVNQLFRHGPRDKHSSIFVIQFGYM